MNTSDTNETRLAAEHDQVSALLPWFANNTLAGAEFELARRHVGECLACRRELGNLRKLAIQLTTVEDAVPISASESFIKLATQIKPRSQLYSSSVRPIGAKRTPRSLAYRQARYAGLALAATIVLMFGTTALHQVDKEFAQSFHTLANRNNTVAANNGDLRLVFKSTVSPIQIEALLTEIGGTIAAGPNQVGAYTVRLGSREGKQRDTEKLIAQLRAREEVVLAEQVNSGS